MELGRLEFIISLALGFLGAPLSAPAQQPPGKTARIGFLGDVPSFLDDAFRQGLRELGYIAAKSRLPAGYGLGRRRRVGSWPME